MIAIQTKFHGPTNVRGSRISATAERNRVMISVDHSVTHDEAHHKAARALCEKMGWAGRLVCGGTKHGNVYVFDPEYPRLNDTVMIVD